MTKPCEACRTMNELGRWLIALPLRLTAFVLILFGFMLMWIANWLAGEVTE